MKKLNKKGKILVTSLTFMLSVVIYVLMAKLGELASNNGIYQLAFICGWVWLLFGQIGAYIMIWGEGE